MVEHLCMCGPQLLATSLCKIHLFLYFLHHPYIFIILVENVCPLLECKSELPNSFLTHLLNYHGCIWHDSQMLAYGRFQNGCPMAISATSQQMVHVCIEFPHCCSALCTTSICTLLLHTICCDACHLPMTILEHHFEIDCTYLCLLVDNGSWS